MNPIELGSLSYPIFKLPTKPNVDEGVIYYYSETEKDDVIKKKLLVVDDTSMAGETLAMRRLQILADSIPLQKLKYAIFFLGDLIKLASAQTYFIDSNGKLFNYKKTITAKLKYHKVTKIMPIPTGGAIIAVEGIPQRFKVLQVPNEDKTCAGILHSGMSSILYGLYDHIPVDTVRRI